MPTQFIEGTNLFLRASLVAQRLKHLPPMRETQVRSLGWEDPLGKEMVTHSSILAWRIPWTEKPGRLQSTGSQRVGHDFTFTFNLSLLYIFEFLVKIIDHICMSLFLGSQFIPVAYVSIFYANTIQF